MKIAFVQFTRMSWLKSLKPYEYWWYKQHVWRRVILYSIVIGKFEPIKLLNKSYFRFTEITSAFSNQFNLILCKWYDFRQIEILIGNVVSVLENNYYKYINISHLYIFNNYFTSIIYLKLNFIKVRRMLIVRAREAIFKFTANTSLLRVPHMAHS